MANQIKLTDPWPGVPEVKWKADCAAFFEFFKRKYPLKIEVDYCPNTTQRGGRKTSFSTPTKDE